MDALPDIPDYTDVSIRWGLSVPTGGSGDDFFTALTQKVRTMLEKEPEKLMQALYMLDIPEQKLQQALTKTAFADIPGAIAHLILQREARKWGRT